MLGRRFLTASAAAAGLLLAPPAATGTSQADRGDTYLVGKVTGPGPANFSGERWNVWETDLGSMFEHEGKIYMVFGDTFGLPTGDWRSNVMARLDVLDPRVGPKFEAMIEDRPGHAKELLASKKVDGDEMTVIPNYGTSDGSRMFLHYMSIRTWAAADPVLNHSGLAYSDDDGQTWTKSAAMRWQGNTNFGVAAFTTVGQHTYVFGIPTLRRGGIKLARVLTSRLLEPGAYRYWNGSDWTADPDEVAKIVKSSDPDRGGTYGLVVPPPVGELSVQWNSHYRKWLMMYSRAGVQPDYAAVVRTADCLTGPWSEESIVVDSSQYPTLYAPFMPPRGNDGPDVHFAMSIYGVTVGPLPPVPYNVWWMHTSLDGVEPAPVDRCVSAG